MSEPLRRSRRDLIVVATILILLPVVGWLVLLETGLVASPGEPLEPPFNQSDRISTIQIVEGEDGVARARFKGWREGDEELSAEEFYDLLLQRQKTASWIFLLLDVTSWTGVAWVVFGFFGQVVFMGRLIVQWRASEKAKTSVVPTLFWWLSLLGSTMLMIYFIWRWEPIGLLGQSTGWVIYLRNLWFIYGQPKTLEEAER
ncbi:MAG: lipid-A-disaccharide synthase N-terminal domain-containing protein [Verrucomicrobiota bacterium]